MDYFSKEYANNNILKCISLTAGSLQSQLVCFRRFPPGRQHDPCAEYMVQFYEAHGTTATSIELSCIQTCDCVSSSVTHLI